MFAKKDEEEHSYWISFTDLVSGFMMVFIMVSLVALHQLASRSAPASLTDGQAGKYGELIDTFKDRLNVLGDDVEIADSATIRFLVNTDSGSPLFRTNRTEPTTRFRGILDQFIPIYLEVLREEFLLQSDSFRIQEIRIEGHTDPAGDYLSNLNLSSGRALAVHSYILGSTDYKRQDSAFQSFIRENTIACGYSFAHTLNEVGQRVDHQSPEVDYDKSRRVEFRILLAYSE